jgi:hypothetical protein
MFERTYDRLKREAREALRLWALAAACASAATIAQAYEQTG